MFHAPQVLKDEVMAALGWDTLRNFITPPTPLSLRSQAFAILQNIFDDQTQSQLTRTVDTLGADALFGMLHAVLRAPSSGDEAELRGTAMFILGSLALGNERLRRSITDRVPLLEALSDALNTRDEHVRLPALRALRHLLEKNSDPGRAHRPRQGVVDLLKPYQLQQRVREVAENAPSTTVRQRARELLEILERAR